MALMSLEEISSIIRDYLKKNYDLQLIYLFGSVLTSNFNQQSDIDIAVFMENFDLLTKIEISRELEQLLNRQVDLIDFKKIDVNFATEIIASGTNIYSKNQDFQAEYEMKILSKYLTLEEDRKVVIEAIYKRGSVYATSDTKQD